MESKKALFSFIFGILALGILSGQLVFADPGEDETGNSAALERSVLGTLDLVEPDPNVGTTFFGNGGYSADGAGVSGSGTLFAEVPQGSTVEQAYLYSTTLYGPYSSVTVNFDGTQYVLNEMPNSTYDGCCNLQSFKNSSPQLLNQIKAKVGSGSNTPISFPFSEISPSTSNIDGVALVVVYSNPALPENSIAIGEGGLPVTSQKTIIGLAQPLDKTVPGFEATLALGIGFSWPGADGSCYAGQVSRVDINGQRLTSCAGGADDGFNSDGGLFTVGGVGDDTNNPPDPNGPGGQDDELYDISGLLNQGDTQIEIDTFNFSSNDIIFLAIVQLTAKASVGEICGDGIDNDNDGFIDEGCTVAPPPVTCVDYDFDQNLPLPNTVNSSAFDSDPSNLSGFVNFESVQGFTAEGFSGEYLRNTSGGDPAAKTTLTLTDLPTHASVDIGFLLAIIDSWDDATDVGTYSPDILNVEVDGNSIFSSGFRGDGDQAYVPSSGVLLLDINDGQDRAGNPNWNDSAYDMAKEPIFQAIPHTSDTLTIDWFASGSGWQGGDDESWAMDNLQVCVNAAAPSTPTTSNGGDNQWDTRPTFGVSHETRQGLVVENGFSFNNEYYTLTNNHHTEFDEKPIMIGTVNSFSATVYADKQLKVQEFLFGIPTVGESHLAELGVEVWYDIEGQIEDVKVVQESDVIDAETVSVSHEKVKCLSTDTEAKCVTTSVSMKFLEPLMDKVMAIKAIDFKNRDHRTYLNEGFDISGESLNPMKSNMIPSTVRNEGLISVSQVAKYSPYWVAEDGRMFEMNSFGSFKQINQKFERFQDAGEAKTRLHSAFGGIVQNEKDRALEVFDATKLIAELPDSFGYHFEISERMNDELRQEMLLQQEIATEILDKMDRQIRDY